MNGFITVVSLGFLSLVGFVVTKGFDLLPKKSTLFIVGLSYGLGVGLITAQMYLYARMGILWSSVNLLLPWVLLMAVLYLFQRKKIRFFTPFPPKAGRQNDRSFDGVIAFLLIGILFCVFYTVFEAVMRPLTVWDGWAAWIIKSKAFFLDKTITIPTLQYIRSDGPLVISLLGTFVYVMLGSADDTAVLLSSSAFYIFLLILFYSALKERYSTRYALFFTFLLATTQTLIRQGGRMEAGQADLPLGYFIFVTAVLFLDYFKSAKTPILILLIGFVSMTTFIKFDAMPFVLLMIVMICFVIYQKKTYYQVPLLLLWLIPFLDWQYYKKMTHLDGIYMEGHGIVFSMIKIMNAFIGSLKALVNIKSWNLLWFAYFYCFFFLFSPKNKELVILHIIVLSQLGVYLLIYFFTAGNAPESSAQRLLVHVAPLALYTIALHLNTRKK